MAGRNTAAWAFGMAPPKNETQAHRADAVAYLLDLIDGDAEPYPLPSRLDQLSTVKGLFSRCWREDQWDWFTVKAQLAHPPRGLAQGIAASIGDLRGAIRDGRINDTRAALFELRRLDARHGLLTFLGRAERRSRATPGSGWLYILSTREANTVLKIGMTTRSVEERVREINSATGMLTPFGVWRCWRVADAADVEKRVHAALSDCRVRPDREFFRVSIKAAEAAVLRSLEEVNASNTFRLANSSS